MAAQTGGGAAKEFTHFVSIDFGTSGCGIAMATKANKSDIKLFTEWEGMRTDAKCPTVLLLDPSGEFVSFGLNASTSYQNKNQLPHPERANEYLIFQKFKMHLYDNAVRILFILLCTLSILVVEQWGGTPMDAVLQAATAIKILTDKFLS